MASAMIHIAVASEINKTINRDRNRLLIGSIAPDLAKILGQYAMNVYRNANPALRKKFSSLLKQGKQMPKAKFSSLEKQENVSSSENFTVHCMKQISIGILPTLKKLCKNI